MIITKEFLLENIKQAITLCNECIKTYADVFSWHSRHANHHLSFIPFYKDYGIWQGLLEQTPIFINDNDSIDNQLKTYTDELQKGIDLYNRAANALNEDEISNVFEKGPAEFFIKCGKLEAQIQLIRQLEKILGEPVLPDKTSELALKQKH